MVLTVIENPKEIKNGFLRRVLVSGIENVLIAIDLLDNDSKLKRERIGTIQSALENGQDYNPQIVKINEREYIHYELVRGKK